MPTFRYTARDDRQRPQSGVVDAATVSEAAAQLEAKGLTIEAIVSADREEAKPSEALTAAVRNLRDHRGELLPPITAYVNELPHGKRRRELRGIVGTLQNEDEESTLAAAAAQPVAWASLLASATQTAATDGSQPSLLARFVDRDQRAKRLRNYRLLALAYPTLVFLLLLTLIWPIASWIVPIFKDIYQEFGLELPRSTQLLLLFGEFFANGGGVSLLVFGVIALVAVLFWPAWQPQWLGKVVKKLDLWQPQSLISAAQFTRHTADLLEAGLPIDEATAHASHAGDNVSPRPAAAYALEITTPPEARIALLRSLSACYSDRPARRVSSATGAIGPVGVILVGMLVGFTMVALFAPLVSLIRGLT